MKKAKDGAAKPCLVSPETLLQAFLKQADEATLQAVAAHLDAGCPVCAPRWARLQRMASALSAPEVPTVSVEARQRVAAAFRERYAAPACPPLLARLVLDSRQPMALTGARHAEGTSFQLVYRTGAHDIDLWQERRSDGRWRLMGQVLPRQGGPALRLEETQLIASNGVATQAAWLTSEWEIEAALPGQYALRLRLPEGEIVVPELPVGMPHE